MLQTFILKLLVQAVQNKEIRAFLFEAIDRLAGLLAPKLMAVVPHTVAAAIQALSGLAPGLPHIPDVGAFAETIRDNVNVQVPGVDIPILSDVVKDVTGFDLTDWLNTRRG